jgi:hypothetical protein
MKEDWAYIDRFPDYAVSNLGFVVNIKYGRLIKPQATSRGYMKVTLQANGESCQIYVHQLVAEAFLCDYRKGLRVAHIDGHLCNNEILNLKLIKGKESREPIFYDSPRLHARRLRIIETGEIFRTAYDCAGYIGGQASKIYAVLNGQRTTHLGYTFEYIEIEV